MNNNIIFLEFILKNTEMGYKAIECLINETNEHAFKKILNDELIEYKEIHEEAKKLLEKFCSDKHHKSQINDITTYIMIKMNLIKNKSTSHLAEMMVQGSNMGIIDITKKINSFKDVDKDVYKLATRLLKFEEKNIEILQPFLKEEKH